MEKERFTVKFAESEQENNAAYALRFSDMLKEYRPEVQRENDLDVTPYDEFARQVICIDNDTGEVVGCYRIITTDTLPKNRSFVCEEEFDISALKETKERIAELSRAVVKKEYRNSMVLMLLFRFIISYLKQENFRFIVGEASFFGTDKNVWAKEISYLASFHAAEGYGIVAREKEQIELIPKEQLDTAAIKRSLPPLIRAYLGFGAKVSTDTFTDREFGSVDIFILMDSHCYNEAYIKRLLRM